MGECGSQKENLSGLDAFLEGEFRLRDNLRAVDRWGGTAGLSYRLFPFLKASAGILIFITIIRIKRPRRKTIFPNTDRPGIV